MIEFPEVHLKTWMNPFRYSAPCISYHLCISWLYETYRIQGSPDHEQKLAFIRSIDFRLDFHFL